MLATAWLQLLGWADRIRREERGDGLVNWVVLAVGLAAGAVAGIVSLITGAITI